MSMSVRGSLPISPGSLTFVEDASIAYCLCHSLPCLEKLPFFYLLIDKISGSFTALSIGLLLQLFVMLLVYWLPYASARPYSSSYSVSTESENIGSSTSNKTFRASVGISLRTRGPALHRCCKASGNQAICRLQADPTYVRGPRLGSIF